MAGGSWFGSWRNGLSDPTGQHLVDSRTGRNRQFPLAELLRQSVFSRLAGYEDVNDATRGRLYQSTLIGEGGRRMVFAKR
jgi:hypothetical protein